MPHLIYAHPGQSVYIGIMPIECRYIVFQILKESFHSNIIHTLEDMSGFKSDHQLVRDYVTAMDHVRESSDFLSFSI